MIAGDNHITAHQGFPIYFKPVEFEGDDPGYFWQEGGYFETIEECKADIADWNKAELRREREFNPQDDTPSITPWFAST